MVPLDTKDLVSNWLFGWYILEISRKLNDDEGCDNLKPDRQLHMHDIKESRANFDAGFAVPLINHLCMADGILISQLHTSLRGP